MTEAASLERRRGLHRRAVWLEYFTVGWNVIEGVVAIGAGIIAGSVALVGFGVDSSIEVISALGLLWRLRKAGPDATVAEESGAERRALYVVTATFLLLAAYITFERSTACSASRNPTARSWGWS
jgi:divalent metal cation (Fe/Co/Zn/Cd) transporter